VGQAEKLQGLPDQYAQPYKKYTDADGMKIESKDKAVKVRPLHFTKSSTNTKKWAICIPL
jgi:hypothetical protein